MAPLFLTDVIVNRTHSTTTHAKVMKAFVCVLGDGCINQIHMFPKKDGRTGEDYWKIAIEFSKLDYNGHAAEEKVQIFNERLRRTGEMRVFFAEVSPNGKRYFLKCVVDQKIVRRKVSGFPTCFAVVLLLRRTLRLNNRLNKFKTSAQGFWREKNLSKIKIKN